MTNVGKIITRYRTNMEAAGLLKPAAPAQLSPQVKAMRPSLTKARLALQERPPVVQVSPMVILFETTLPNIEHVLVEVGEVRAEEIVGRLCEHGQEMIAEHGIEGSKQHLEGLFKDLPDYEEKLKKEDGLEEVIKAYRELDFKGKEKEYLILNFDDMISYLALDDDGMIDLVMKQRRTNDSNLVCLQKVKNLRALKLNFTLAGDAGLKYLRGLVHLERLDLNFARRVGDAGLAHLRNLVNLWELTLTKTQVSDIGLIHLRGLTDLEVLGLWGTKISDAGLAHLRDLVNLRKLYIGGNPITDAGLVHLRGLVNLQELFLAHTQVSEAGIKDLQKAIPGLIRIKDD